MSALARNNGPLSLARMRADIAQVLHVDLEEVGDHDSLIDLGLDSIRAMVLVTRWRAEGVDLAFAELAQTTTLAHWGSVAQAALARGSGST
jgi:aryl carrier-like protein